MSILPGTRRGIRWGVALSLAALTVALGLGPTATPAASAPSGSVGGGSAPGRVVVAPGFEPPAGARPLGPVPAATPVSLIVGLASRDPGGFEARTILEETPGTPLYRQYLSPSEVAGAYGAARAERSAALRYFASAGLNASISPDGLLLTVDGPAASVDRAFGTSLARYAVDGRTVFAHAGPASLPAGIAWSGVLGLGNTTPIVPSVGPEVRVVPDPAPASSGCPTNGLLYPCNISKAYNISSLLADGIDGSGRTIAVVDAYDSSEGQPLLSSDLDGFVKAAGLARGNVSFLYPVPTSSDLNRSASSGWGAEDALDLEWARASAPGASVDMVLSPNPSVGLYESVDWIVAHAAADVISLSWGEPDVGIYNAFDTPCSDQCNATTDGSYELLHPVLEAAAAEGIGVFAASDDCGAAGGTSGVSTDFPASDPYVTGVGGTVLDLTESGAYQSETGWSGNASGAESPGCVNQGGSGGGYSPYPRPSWQVAPGLNASRYGRGVPDVAMDAATYAAVVIDNETAAVGGTSVGTPIWAGLELLADQLAGESLGSLDPSLYAIARGSSYASDFHEITSGNNGYPAGAGWNPVTGLGTPIAAALLPALSRGPFVSDGLSATLYGSPRLGPSPLTTTFHVVPANGTASYPFVDVAFGDGNASLVPASMEINHTYTAPGVYAATVTVVDGRGNSSTAPPIAVVVGGGTELNVSLNVSNPIPAVASPVTLTATAANGTAPYRYSFYFGDGTYALNLSSDEVVHAYGAPGGFCAAVIVSDAGVPIDGGASARVPVTVGGAAAPSCPTPRPLTATFSSAVTSADLPGDLPFRVVASGGSPPVSVAYVAADPYVRACDCGIFHEPGNFTVRAYVNDSLDEQTVAALNVSLHPALALNATASALVGPAPLTVDFRAGLSGGYRNATPTLDWSFGDGTTLDGSNASPTHVYAVPGIYTAWVVGLDSGGGRASAAWLINVTANATPTLAVGATIAPALDTPAGTPLSFHAEAFGGSGPVLFRWQLGANDSAFGANVTQTYPDTGCLGTGACALDLRLTASDAAGASWSTTVRLPDAVHGRWSGANFTDSGEIPDGVTPYRITADAQASGVLGLAVGWSFGDGGTATGSSVVHTYYAPGNYTLTETAVDPYGDRLVRTHALTVTGATYTPLNGSVNASVAGGIAPLAVTFNSSASGGVGAPYTVSWSFGDGTNASGPVGVPIAHTYEDAGNFSATATIADVRGDRIVRTVNLTVHALTAVFLSVGLAPRTVTTAGTVTVSVEADVACTVASVPGCTNGSIALWLGVGSPNGTPSGSRRVLGPIAPNASGDLIASIGPFANLSGPVWVWAVVEGPNYTGAGHAPLLVEGVTVPCAACGTGPLLGFPAGPALALLLASATATAALVVFFATHRRRSLAPPPPPPVPP